MLYHLLLPLQPHFTPLRLIQYITVRGALAITVALLVSLFFGPAFIRFLKRLDVGQFVLTKR